MFHKNIIYIGFLLFFTYFFAENQKSFESTDQGTEGGVSFPAARAGWWSSVYFGIIDQSQLAGSNLDTNTEYRIVYGRYPDIVQLRLAAGFFFDIGVLDNNFPILLLVIPNTFPNGRN